MGPQNTEIDVFYKAQHMSRPGWPDPIRLQERIPNSFIYYYFSKI